MNYLERFQAMTFFLEILYFQEKKCITRQQFQVMTFFYREISKYLGRKLVLIALILRLKVTISHKNFLPANKVLHVLLINYSQHTHFHDQILACKLHGQTQRSPHATAWKIIHTVKLETDLKKRSFFRDHYVLRTNFGSREKRIRWS